MPSARETNCRCHGEACQSAPSFQATGSSSVMLAATSQPTPVPRDARPLRPSASLCRLAELDPFIARELGDVWCDLESAGRLLEGLLGGEAEVVLEFEVIVELVRLYEHLEDVRTAPVDDLAAGAHGLES